MRQDAPATDAMTASAISMERATAGLPLQFQVGVGPALLLESGGWNLGQRDQLADEPVVIRANEIRSPLEGGAVDDRYAPHFSPLTAPAYFSAPPHESGGR